MAILNHKQVPRAKMKLIAFIAQVDEITLKSYLKDPSHTRPGTRSRVSRTLRDFGIEVPPQRLNSTGNALTKNAKAPGNQPEAKAHTTRFNMFNIADSRQQDKTLARKRQSAWRHGRADSTRSCSGKEGHTEARSTPPNNGRSPASVSYCSKGSASTIAEL